ncbi:helix-turn-helix transcriptional regulator [Caballeronia sp. DA-9]|uniref:helix-turn-helix transcriptional regulator n=1 Tax=Caballeronia sp. DA-9 TaxID=3436237 RepID=UPI003F66891C
MRFWNISADSGTNADGRSLLPIIDAIGTDRPEALSDAVLHSLQAELRAKHCSIFHYRNARVVEFVSGADLLSQCVATENAKPYIAGGIFHLDSNQGILNDKAATLPGRSVIHHQTIADLRGSAHKELYFNASLLERVSVMHCLADRSWLAINLYRQRCDGAMTEEELLRAAQLGPAIAHCVARHVQLVGERKHNVAPGPMSELDLLAEIEMVYPHIPKREREVMCGLLRGLTADGIACHLGVGAATVVTYKQRLFRRLEINTRSQLFAAFAKYK